MKRKQHLQSFLSVCNKRLQLQDMLENVRQSNLQLVFLQTIYLKKKQVNSTQDRVLLSLTEKNVLTWHQTRPKRREIMKRKQRLQSFLNVCNKRLLSASA